MILKKWCITCIRLSFFRHSSNYNRFEISNKITYFHFHFFFFLMPFILIMLRCRNIQGSSCNLCHLYHFQMNPFKISLFRKFNVNSLISVYKQSHPLFIHINQFCFLHIFSLAKMPYIQRQNISMIVIHMIQNSFYAYIHFSLLLF